MHKDTEELNWSIEENNNGTRMTTTIRIEAQQRMTNIEWLYFGPGLFGFFVFQSLLIGYFGLCYVW